jgi:hypothetical protein
VTNLLILAIEFADDEKQSDAGAAGGMGMQDVKVKEAFYTPDVENAGSLMFNPG